MGIANTIPCVNCTEPRICIDKGACIFDFVKHSMSDNFDLETEDGFTLLSDVPGDEIINEY